MKIVRFWDSAVNGPLWGIVESETVYALAGTPYGDDLKVTKAAYPLASLRLLAPCEPTKIVCGGLNYYGHAKEVGLPIPKVSACFLKPPSGLVGQNEPIEYPAETERLEFEGELAVVVKHRMRSTPPEEVSKHILGYTCANDVTARDIQIEGGNFLNICVAKAFDTFCPLGPWLVTDVNPDALDLTLTVNGKVRQKTNTSDMIFPVATMLSYFSHIMTLLPGDLVLTGTPAGIGRMEIGETAQVAIEGIGTLSNPIVASSRRSDPSTSSRRETRVQRGRGIPAATDFGGGKVRRLIYLGHFAIVGLVEHGVPDLCRLDIMQPFEVGYRPSLNLVHRGNPGHSFRRANLPTTTANCSVTPQANINWPASRKYLRPTIGATRLRRNG
jgi:2-keto-4-pentenoate hydratase/2-oxohepta-3-ene-1,7-dioic acid hydratase in catechol pathway